jgi:hypothetical protein
MLPNASSVMSGAWESAKQTLQTDPGETEGNKVSATANEIADFRYDSMEYKDCAIPET